MSEDNGHRDVVIRAPAAKATRAVLPSPEEIIQFQAVQISELEAELAERTVAASTIANAAINLLDRLAAHSDVTREGGAVFDKETWERTKGLQLTIETNDLSNLMTIRAREAEKPAPLAYEDRRDD